MSLQEDLARNRAIYERLTASGKAPVVLPEQEGWESGFVPEERFRTLAEALAQGEVQGAAAPVDPAPLFQGEDTPSPPPRRLFGPQEGDGASPDLQALASPTAPGLARVEVLPLPYPEPLEPQGNRDRGDPLADLVRRMDYEARRGPQDIAGS